MGQTDLTLADESSNQSNNQSSLNATAPPPASNVKVCIRVRPLLPYEISANANKIIGFPAPNSISINLSNGQTPKVFTFDYVFDDLTNQSIVYSQCVEPLVLSLLTGYNATILAYGQTGSGKTHTMGTAATEESINQSNNQSVNQLGLIPRVIKDIFRHIHERQNTHSISVKCSFLEIYNEEIHDLLLIKQSVTSTDPPYIREGPNNQIIVQNLTEEEVPNYQSMMRCLIRGSAQRVTGATQMNASSSRSHAVFTITVTQRKLSPLAQLSEQATDPASAPSSTDDVIEETIQSKFHFVDLAGSERLKRTGAVGDRMKEGISINQGLLALGNCISALASQSTSQAGSAKKHVPFRDSKITRILQDSLGGNSQTLMIACISPADLNADETNQSVNYANRTKNIKNSPTINRDPIAIKIEGFNRLIERLVDRLTIAERALVAAPQNESVESILHGSVNQFIDENQSIKQGKAPVATSQSTTQPINQSSNNQSTPAINQADISAEELRSLKDQSLTYELEVRRLIDRLKAQKEQMHALGNQAINAQIERDAWRLKCEQLLGKQEAISEAKSQEINPSIKQSVESLNLPSLNEPELTLIVENRRLINKQAKKLISQSKELAASIRIIETLQASGLNFNQPINSASKQSSKKTRRRKRAPRASLTPSSNRSSNQSEESDPESTTRRSTNQSVNQSDESSQSELSDVDEEFDEHAINQSFDQSDQSTDEEADSLSILAELKAAEHAETLANYQSVEASINQSINEKQQTINQTMNHLKSQSATVLALRSQYEKKINDMEKEMNDLVHQRDQVLNELKSQSQNKSINQVDYETLSNQTINQFKSKLTLLTEQLRSTKEKLKENDRLKKQLMVDEQKITQLNQSIEQSKKAKVALLKQIDQSNVQYREWLASKEQKLQSLNKQSIKQSLLIKKLEQQSINQSMKLARREEEKAALIKQLKTQQSIKQSAKQQREKTATQLNNQSRPPRVTPVKRRPANQSNNPAMNQSIKKHRSPAARAKAHSISISAAALSDSSIQSINTSGNQITDAQLYELIDAEISLAVSRSMLSQSINQAITQRNQLYADSAEISDMLINQSINTDADKQRYSELESKWASITASIQSIEQSITKYQTELAKVNQSTNQSANQTPMKPSSRTSKQKPSKLADELNQAAADHSINQSVNQSSGVDYRLFSRIRIQSLEASKRAIVYLFNQIINQSVNQSINSKDFQKERDHWTDRERTISQSIGQMKQRFNLEMKRRFLQTSPLVTHFQLSEMPNNQPDNSSSPTQTQPISNQTVQQSDDDDEAYQREEQRYKQSLNHSSNQLNTSFDQSINQSNNQTISPSNILPLIEQHSPRSPVVFSPIPSPFKQSNKQSSNQLNNQLDHSTAISQLDLTDPSLVLTNNFLTDDVEIDHSDQINGSSNHPSPHSFTQPIGSSSVNEPPSSRTHKLHSGNKSHNQSATQSTSQPMKPQNVYSRLTDTSQYTGMYAKIAEESKHKHHQSNNQPGGQTNNRLPQLVKKNSSATTKQPFNQSTNSQQSNSSTTPRLLQPTESSSSDQSTNQSATHSKYSNQPVFNRLTNPANFTGAHRARFGLEVQTKQPNAPNQPITQSVNPSSTLSNNLSIARRAHSRNGSTHDFAVDDQAINPLTIVTPRIPTLNNQLINKQSEDELREPVTAIQLSTRSDLDDQSINSSTHQLDVEADQQEFDSPMPVFHDEGDSNNQSANQSNNQSDNDEPFIHT